MSIVYARVIIADLKDELVAAIKEINALRDRHNKDPLQPADHWEYEGVHDAHVWLVNNQYNEQSTLTSVGTNGLTKREHFAGLAMQALLAKHGNENADDCASYAVEYANALLKALENSND